MNASRHEDYCTLFKYEEDKDILTRPLFDVNMRLFRVNGGYRSIVQVCCDYIRECAMTSRERYKEPHGYSGANAGIPFNIIASSDGTVMINPKIIWAVGELEYMSNCGSLMLSKPIRVKRHATICYTYFNRDGVSCEGEGCMPTVQHEIDHNNGILIWDREIKT